MGGELCVPQHIMSLEKMKNTTFIKPSMQDWSEKAEESLKGKKLESLKKHTYEKITLKPLYTQEDLSISIGYPGISDFRRGSKPLGHVGESWYIAQEVPYQSLAELETNLYEVLEKGQNTLSFQLKEEILKSPIQLKQLMSKLAGRFPFAIQTNGHQHLFLATLSELNNFSIQGFVAEDPISRLVENGYLSFELPHYYPLWAESIQQADEKLPNLKTILVDTSVYHNGGANAVQELAIALATGVYYIEELKKYGLDPIKVFNKLVFKFQIGANFFTELSKLRAARVLWDKIGEAYGVPIKYRGMEVIGETSHFTKTRQDPHVNILRAGNEAFAAVLGGVQFLQVHPFNELEGATPLAERLARNTQLILKEEAFLQNIVDPAGGSWYIESLTNELIEKAWSYFLLIEEKGGLWQALESNWLQSEIKAVLNNRQQDAFNRKQSIIGTNVYANLDESIVYPTEHEEINSIEQKHHHIQPIISERLAEPFEKLRIRSLKINSKVGLICLGELKQYKARADFMTGFLASGGINAIKSSDIQRISEIQDFISHSNCLHYVLCSSNDVYQEVGLEIMKQIKQEYPSVNFYLAGLPEKEACNQWLEAGIREFVHVKSNCYEFNSSIIRELEEVGQDE
jgi:methylmalonyl-CoA mutase